MDFFIKIKKSIKYYLRYLDDFVILVENKEEARNLFYEISCFLEGQLHLSLNPKSCYFPSTHGVMFCGFKIFEDHVLLSRKVMRRMLHRYKSDNSLYSSFYAHFHHANHYNLLGRFTQ